MHVGERTNPETADSLGCELCHVAVTHWPAWPRVYGTPLPPCLGLLPDGRLRHSGGAAGPVPQVGSTSIPKRFTDAGVQLGCGGRVASEGPAPSAVTQAGVRL